MKNQYFEHILASIRLHPAVQLTTAIVLTGAFFIMSNFFLIKTNFDNILTQWGENVQLNVYLGDKATESNRMEIHSKLSQLEEFDSVKFISKDQAAKDFMESMASYAPDLLGDEEFGNPLPASFELSMRASIPVVEHLGVLKSAAERIKNLVGVEEVSYGQGWVENYSQFVAGVKSTSYSVLVLLILGTILVVGNSIKSSISQRMDEIEVLELVGATSKMIRAPYVVEGALMGLFASITAMLVGYLFFQWQLNIVNNELQFLSFAGDVKYFSWLQITMLAFAGSAIGATGAFLSVRKLNSGWAAAKKSNGKSWAV